MIKTKEKSEKEVYAKIAGLIYRLVFQKANGATNEAYNYVYRGFFKKIFCCRWRKKKYVKNLWDRLESKPIAPYDKYDPAFDVWRDY